MAERPGWLDSGGWDRAMWASVVEGLPGAVVFTRADDGLVLYANGVARRMAEAADIVLVGRNIAEIFSSDSLDAQPIQWEAVRSGETVISVRRLATRDGVRRWVMLSTRLVAPGVLGSVAQDVTDTMEAHRRLAESEERYRTAFATSPDAININRLDGLYVAINEGFTQLTGYTEEDVLGRLSSEIGIWAVPQDRERLVAGLRRDGKVENLQSLFRCKDGSLKHGLMSAKIIPIEGEPHILSVTRDIDPLVAAQRALQDHKERLAAILETLGDPVLVAGADGKVQWCNAAVTTLCGHDVAGVRDRSIVEWMRFYDGETPHPHPVDEVVRTGSALVRHEPVTVETDAKRVRVTYSATPLLQDGAVDGVVLVLRDVTWTERFIEELQAAHSMHSLSVLAGGIAHDFNNVLAGVTGALDILRMSCTGSREQEILERAFVALERAANLARRLISFASGGRLDKQTVDVVELVEQAARFAVTGSGVHLLWSGPAEPVFALVDRHQWSQVVDNLVINARQSGAQRIWVTLAATGEPGADDAAISVRVEDDGPGIPQDVLPRLFDPFFTTKEGGSGLGLTVVRSIVEGHGGRIEVAPRPGGGTAVGVVVPWRTAEVVRAPSDAPPVAVDGTGRTAWVLDDEPLVRAYVVVLLQDWGFDVCEFESDAALLSRVDAGAQEPDLVITDLVIPGGSGGAAVARAVRGRWPRVPVVAVTGYTEVDLRGDPGLFSAVVTKPFAKGDLAAAIAACLSG